MLRTHLLLDPFMQPDYLDSLGRTAWNASHNKKYCHPLFCSRGYFPHEELLGHFPDEELLGYFPSEELQAKDYVLLDKGDDDEGPQHGPATRPSASHAGPRYTITLDPDARPVPNPSWAPNPCSNSAAPPHCSVWKYALSPDDAPHIRCHYPHQHIHVHRPAAPSEAAPQQYVQDASKSPVHTGNTYAAHTGHGRHGVPKPGVRTCTSDNSIHTTQLFAESLIPNAPPVQGPKERNISRSPPWNSAVIRAAANPFQSSQEQYRTRTVGKSASCGPVRIPVVVKGRNDGSVKAQHKVCSPRTSSQAHPDSGSPVTASSSHSVRSAVPFATNAPHSCSAVANDQTPSSAALHVPPMQYLQPTEHAQSAQKASTSTIQHALPSLHARSAQSVPAGTVPHEAKSVHEFTSRMYTSPVDIIPIESTSVEASAVELTPGKAAVILQTAWRRHRLVREHATFKTLCCAAAQMQFANTQIHRYLTLNHSNNLLEKQILEVSELLMRAVLTLDSVSCQAPEYKALKKRLTTAALQQLDQVQQLQRQASMRRESLLQALEQLDEVLVSQIDTTGHACAQEGNVDIQSEEHGDERDGGMEQTTDPRLRTEVAVSMEFSDVLAGQPNGQGKMTGLAGRQKGDLQQTMVPRTEAVGDSRLEQRSATDANHKAIPVMDRVEMVVSSLAIDQVEGAVPSASEPSNACDAEQDAEQNAVAMMHRAEPTVKVEGADLAELRNVEWVAEARVDGAEPVKVEEVQSAGGAKCGNAGSGGNSTAAVWGTGCPDKGKAQHDAVPRNDVMEFMEVAAEAVHNS